MWFVTKLGRNMMYQTYKQTHKQTLFQHNCYMLKLRVTKNTNRNKKNTKRKKIQDKKKIQNGKYKNYEKLNTSIKES